MVGDANWYAVYTKPRWEKKVAKALEEKNIQVYCPLNRVVRQWSDRKKMVLEPLFKGYVFVYIQEKEKLAILQTPGVVNFVYWNGKPAIVRASEIDTIQRFLREFAEVDIEELDLQVNNRVIVKNGILVNYQGIVLEVLGNKAKVLIESMGLKLSAKIDKKDLLAI